VTDKRPRALREWLFEGRDWGMLIAAMGGSVALGEGDIDAGDASSWFIAIGWAVLLACIVARVVLTPLRGPDDPR
jgi:hypothetical protein